MEITERYKIGRKRTGEERNGEEKKIEVIRHEICLDCIPHLLTAIIGGRPSSG